MEIHTPAPTEVAAPAHCAGFTAHHAKALSATKSKAPPRRTTAFSTIPVPAKFLNLAMKEKLKFCGTCKDKINAKRARRERRHKRIRACVVM